MSYNVKLVADAKSDFAEAHSYYLKISRKIATNFGKEVKYAIEHLAINPFFEIRAQNYRAIPLKKFPYIIFFEVDQAHKDVKVIAIFNTNRNTEKYPR